LKNMNVMQYVDYECRTNNWSLWNLSCYWGFR
jgi:hypothetical protein